MSSLRLGLFYSLAVQLLNFSDIFMETFLWILVGMRIKFDVEEDTFSIWLNFYLFYIHPTHTRISQRGDSWARAPAWGESAMQTAVHIFIPNNRQLEPDESGPRALNRLAYWTWQLSLCTDRWLTQVEVVGSALVVKSLSSQQILSAWTLLLLFWGHCLQAQTNSSETGICCQAALSKAACRSYISRKGQSGQL